MLKAVIMAGGEGSRLRPLTCDRPKPLVPVCNRPVITYILDLLAEHGVQEVFLTLGYRPEAISSLLGRRYRGMTLHYVVEEIPLGTAGGVAALKEHLDSTFLVLSGDALTDTDLTSLIEFHKRCAAVATLGLFRVERPLEYGVVLTDRAGRIKRFLEKPDWGEVFSDTVNTGIYVLEPAILNGVPVGRMYDFSRSLFPALLQMDAPLFGQVMDGYWCDIGDPEAYLQANLDLLQGRLRFQPPGQEVAPGIWTMGNVPHGLIVDGPALIGKGCRLAPGIRMEAGTVLGPGTIVEAGTVLRRTVTWSGVDIGSGVTLVGSIVCDGTVLGANVGAYEGAVIGSGCVIGPKATISPNVRLWPKTDVSAGARVDTTLIQSPTWSGRLLHRGGISGRLGSDLFPETTVRVGTAFASVVPDKGPLVIGGDPGAAAMLLKQSIICGALAAGRNVIDIGVSASPVTEFIIGRMKAAAGIHIRASADQARVVFYDHAGLPASREILRKLEQACQRQDFPRATPQAAGISERLAEAEWLYLEHLSQQVDVTAIREARLGVQIDVESWPLLHRWLERLRSRANTSTLALPMRVDLLEATWQVGGLRPESMQALDIWLGAMHHATSGTTVPNTVTAPTMVEDWLASSGRTAVRVRQSEWRGCDPLLGVALLLQWMAREGLTTADLSERIAVGVRVVRTIACPWEAKGRIMRRLLEEHSGNAVDMVDGLRVRFANSWALLQPDPDEPVYHVYTEAADLVAAEDLADRLTRRVEDLLAR